MMQTGFPDFIAYNWSPDDVDCGFELPNRKWFRTKLTYMVIFIEVKSNGYLSKEEKEKAQWYLDNNYCSKFLIASKGKKRGEIIYKEYK